VREREGVGVVFGNVDAESVRRTDCDWESAFVDRIVGVKARSSALRGASTRGLNMVSCNWMFVELDVEAPKGKFFVRRWGLASRAGHTA
jgi:hypothetical protein